MGAILALLLLVSGLALPARAQVATATAGGSSRASFVSQYQRVVPHVVFGGGWHNRFVLANYSETSATVRLNFYGDDGNALAVPIKQSGTNSVLDVLVPGLGARTIETDESPGDALRQGWAMAYVFCGGSTTCENVAIYGIFATAEVPGYPVFEATVFSGDSRTTGTMLPFDNRNGFSTGIAIAARCSVLTLRSVYVAIYYADEPAGTPGHQYAITMTCQGHTSFSLADFEPRSQHRAGLVLVSSSSSDLWVSAIGLLFNPKGGAFTTIPASESVP